MLTGADGRVDALDVQAEPGHVPASSVTLIASASSDVGLWQALLFALLGGLILNLMPCVFPVLSMKALALAAKREAPAACQGGRARLWRGRARELPRCWRGALIALRGGGCEPRLGLPIAAASVRDRAGAFDVRGRAQSFRALRNRRRAPGQCRRPAGGQRRRVGQFLHRRARGRRRDALHGALHGRGHGLCADRKARRSRSACSLALGLGFAAPFMVLGLWPRALRVLPRPGAWMTTLRQVLAFPMYGAAIWLVWVLSLQAGSDGVLAALAAALALAFGLWVYGRSQTAQRRAPHASDLPRPRWRFWRRLAGSARGLGRASRREAPLRRREGALAYEPFSAAQACRPCAQEGRPVFINATAAWCITCLVNEKVALSGEQTGRRLRRPQSRGAEGRLDQSGFGNHRASREPGALGRAALSLLCAGRGEARCAAAAPDRSPPCMAALGPSRSSWYTCVKSCGHKPDHADQNEIDRDQIIQQPRDQQDRGCRKEAPPAAGWSEYRYG